MTTDDLSDQSEASLDRMPVNPFFGMEFRLLAEAAELEEEKPQSGLPLPTDVRSQLLQAAARLDNASTNAQNYSLTATNRFFHCMTEAVSADLQFLAQPGYVPAAQIAKSLHQGVWTLPHQQRLRQQPENVRRRGSIDATYDERSGVRLRASGSSAVGRGGYPHRGRDGGSETGFKGRERCHRSRRRSRGQRTLQRPMVCPWLRCEGCLVYGTAEGGYANFAEAVGGRTINSIAKPVNLNWNQFSAQVHSAVQTKTPVLFSLQGIENIDQVLAGQARTMNTTSYELRYLQQNWPRFQNIVRFYNNGAQVAPPWQIAIHLPGTGADLILRSDEKTRWCHCFIGNRGEHLIGGQPANYVLHHLRDALVDLSQPRRGDRGAPRVVGDVVGFAPCQRLLHRGRSGSTALLSER